MFLILFRFDFKLIALLSWLIKLLTFRISNGTLTTITVFAYVNGIAYTCSGDSSVAIEVDRFSGMCLEKLQNPLKDENKWWYRDITLVLLHNFIKNLACFIIVSVGTLL